MQLTELAHDTLRQVIESGDIAIDATVGNGVDLLFLAQQVGRTGHVYGFDIQAAALRIASQKLQSLSLPDGADSNDPKGGPSATLVERVTLIRESHSTQRANIPSKHHGNIGAVMFNLGYLPHGDHRIITHEKTTTAAIRQSIELLRPQGVITILAYPGHEGGKQELDAIIEMMATSQDYSINWQECGARSNTPTSPRLFVARKQNSVGAASCRD